MGRVCEALGQQKWGNAWNTRGGLAPRRLACLCLESRAPAPIFAPCAPTRLAPRALARQQRRHLVLFGRRQW